MAGLLELMLTIIGAVHIAAVGYQRYSLVRACDETSSEFSYTLDEEIIAYFDYKDKRSIISLPDFITPQEFPELPKEAIHSAGICREILGMLKKVYTDRPPVLNPAWVAIYPKHEVKWKVKNTLICHVSSFFPSPVTITWHKNIAVVTEGVTLSQYFHNADGTLNVFSSLSFTPEEGDEYSCTVEHQEQTETRMWAVEVDQPSVSPPSVLCAVGVVVGMVGVATGMFFFTKANHISR